MSRRGLRANCVLEQEARWRVQSGLRGADGGGGGGGGVGLRMGGGAVAARAYIARTNPNGNSSLGGASPIMHTPVLTGRSCSRSLLVFSLSLSLSPGVSFALSPISPQSLALSRFYPISRNLRLPIPRRPLFHSPTVPSPPTLSWVALSSRGTVALSWETKLRRNSFANRCRCGAKTPALPSLFSPLCDYSHPANVGF